MATDPANRRRRILEPAWQVTDSSVVFDESDGGDCGRNEDKMVQWKKDRQPLTANTNSAGDSRTSEFFWGDQRSSSNVPGAGVEGATLLELRSGSNPRSKDVSDAGLRPRLRMRTHLREVSLKEVVGSLRSDGFRESYWHRDVSDGVDDIVTGTLSLGRSWLASSNVSSVRDRDQYPISSQLVGFWSSCY